jgi:anti-sigma-K factor RskA
MDPRERVEELLPFYALDALSDEERVLVEQHLAEHPEARQEVEEMRRAAAALPYEAVPVEPPPHIKRALLNRLEASTPRPAALERSRRRLSFENLFRVLSLGAATIAVLWVVALNVQVARLQRQIAALQENMAAQSASLAQIIENLPQQNPVITVSLKGTEVQPEAQGQLIANPDSQSAVLAIAGLPQLEPGKTYQVWLIDAGGPVSAGLLTVDEEGQGVLVVTSPDAIGSFQSLGISVEPEGGSEQPTGDIVVLSDL